MCRYKGYPLSLTTIMVVLAMLLLPGCKKDTNSGTPAMRLKSTWYYFYGQTSQKLISTVTYSGNLITEITTAQDYGQGTPVPMDKTTYTYNGNEITMVYNNITNGNLSPRYSHTYMTQNNLITSMIFQPISDSVSEAAQKHIYEYNGDQLIRETKSVRFPGGSWEDQQKFEYSYVNGKPDSCLEYAFTKSAVWHKTGKLVFEYENGKIKQLVHYAFNGGAYVQDYARPYTYDGDRIHTIGAATPDVPETFQYDSNGNVISHTDANQYFNPKTFQYEEGTGNYAFLSYLEDPVMKLENHPMVTCIP